MKRLLLVALFLLTGRTVQAATYYVDPAGSGTTCSFASPCALETITADCGSTGAKFLHAGDTVFLRGGTYLASSEDDYKLAGRCSGTAAAPITFARYQDEEAIIDGKVSWMGVVVSSGTASMTVTDSATPNQSTLQYKFGSVGAFLVGTEWVNRIIEVNPGSRIANNQESTVAPTLAKVVSVTDTTHMEVTAYPTPGRLPQALTCTSLSDNNCADVANLHFKEYIKIQGIKFINSSTKTRFCSTGHATFTNGSKDIVWVDGANDWSECVNNTATVNTSATGNTVTWTAGTKFCRTSCTAGTWSVDAAAGNVGKLIQINGVNYTVASVPTQAGACAAGGNNCTTLTLTTSPGAQTGVTAQLPNSECTDSNPVMNWVIGTFGTADNPTTIQTSRHVYCADATHCQMATAWTSCAPDASPCTREVKWPGLGFTDPDTIRNINMGSNHQMFINNYVWDTSGGAMWGAAAHRGGNIFYGNLLQYFGDIALSRGSGHGFYLQNPIRYNESGRSRWGGNMSLRAFNLTGQVYSETGEGINSFVTFDDNIFLASGHDGWPTSTWTTWGTGAASGGLYIGSTTGSPAGGCPLDYGWPDQGPSVGTSAKIAKGNTINRNFMFINSSSMAMGGAKGACRTTITDNYFFTTGAPGFYNNGSWPPLTMTGNLFTAGYPGAGGNGSPNMPAVNAANYGPSGTLGQNTFLTSLPTTGTDTIFYEPNEYEAGKGFAAVYNPDDSATVTVDLCQFGGGTTAGADKWILFNAQCADPWDCVPVRLKRWDDPGMAAITSCPHNVTVPSTFSASSIIQPGFTDRDGTTPFPKPPDIGPRAVGLSLERDFAVGAPAPTATATNTATPTRTNTFTPTATPTFTASNTPTNTATLTPTVTNTPTRTFTSGGPTITPTFTPSNTPTFTPTPSLTPTLTSTNTPTPSPTPSGSGNATINVANCNLIAPMVYVASGEYPGGYVTSADANDGMIECPFVVPSTATYYVYAKTFEESATEDSFYFTIDDSDLTSASPCNESENTSCTQVFDTASFKDPNDGCKITREWGSVSYKDWNNRAGSDGVCSGEGARYSVALDAGSHTIRVRQRDADTRLYQIRFNTDGNLELQDPEPTPTPCVGSNCRPANCRGSSYSKAQPCRR